MKRKNQKGVTMIITLIVILVFTLLGAAIWQYGINSVKQADKNYKQKQAYYIARSGAEAFSTHILNETDTASLSNDLSKAMDITSLPIDIGDGTCTILLKRNGSKIEIEATGNYKGETAKATLEIREVLDTGMPSNIFENIIFSTGSITLNGNVDITGNLEATGEITVNGANPSYKANSTKIYPTVVFPENTSADKVNVAGGSIEYINGNKSYDEITYDEITVETDGILQINLSGGGDLILVANKIYIEGELRIQGSGRLLLYVKDLRTDNNKGYINIYKPLPIDSFIVLMPQNGFYDVSRFHGLLYAPGASVTIQGDNSFTGAMVAGDVVNNGNTGIIYVTDAGFINHSYFEDVETTKITTIQYHKGQWK